ncbi:ABC transporter permease subunit [Streptomyces sp. PT12]|uniref:ABC transporter permease subunit n=1 Tax=Streptomyces sp. PT12 TaxID=1510197 RepID=UPI00215C6817|nr:ABC transporter permease subunit [Streptomyces sp. PT12]
MTAVYPATFLALLVVAWFAVTATELVEPYIIPSPGDTWQAFADYPDYLWEHTLVTTGETIAGFAIASLVGVLFAVLMVYSSTLEKTFYPLILFAQVIPKIAIAPLFVVWLGFGASPKILVAVLMAFFPVVISGISGLRSVDPELLELTSTMGASPVKTFWKVRFPAALPELLSGLKVAATLAVTGMTVVLVTHSVTEAVYLASLAIVMGPRPGRVIEEFTVDIPGHREYEPTLESPEFQRLSARIRELLGSGAD